MTRRDETPGERCVVCDFRDEYVCCYCGQSPNWRAWTSEQWAAYRQQKADAFTAVLKARP